VSEFINVTITAYHVLCVKTLVDSAELFLLCSTGNLCICMYLCRHVIRLNRTDTFYVVRVTCTCLHGPNSPFPDTSTNLVMETYIWKNYDILYVTRKHVVPSQ